MGKFAPVVPARVLQAMKDRGEFGNYHLVLAHDVVSNDKAYRDLFKGFTGTVIIDNSVVELGEPVDAKTMARACEIIPASYIILPDKVGDVRETIKLTGKWYEEYYSINVPMLAVVQGSTPEDIVAWDIAASEWDIAGVCIPRIMEKYFGTRLKLVTHFRENFKFVHLLGMSNNYHDDVKCARVKGVNGIDSAAPAVLGFLRERFRIVDNTHPGRPDDFWEDVYYTRFVRENILTARALIDDE